VWSSIIPTMTSNGETQIYVSLSDQFNLSKIILSLLYKLCAAIDWTVPLSLEENLCINMKHGLLPKGNTSDVFFYLFL